MWKREQLMETKEQLVETKGGPAKTSCFLVSINPEKASLSVVHGVIKLDIRWRNSLVTQITNYNLRQLQIIMDGSPGKADYINFVSER